MTPEEFKAEFGFIPNEHELRIANHRDPMDESLPYNEKKWNATIEDYRRVWSKREKGDVEQKPLPQKPKPITLADVPCRHRGIEVGEVKCRPCTKGANADVMVPVCECRLHNKPCTAAKTGEQFLGVSPIGCLTCSDRQPDRPKPTKRLTVGMASRQDSCRARWTIRALQEMHGAELEAANITWEILIIDNGDASELAPDGQPHSRHLQSVARNDFVRVVSHNEQGTFPPKAAVFDHAAGEIVVVIDSHVLIRSGGLKRLVEWFGANPEFNGIAHGPILNDTGELLYTHEEREYRGDMLAMWDNYERPTPACTVAKPDGQFGDREVDIPQAGAWQFACRRDAWPREELPKGLKGFGGDENLDRLFQSLGRRVVCLEWFAGWHDFFRTNPRYVNDAYHRFRNDCLWHVACGDLYRIVEAIEHYSRPKERPEDSRIDARQCDAVLAELGLTPVSEAMKRRIEAREFVAAPPVAMPRTLPKITLQ